MNSGWLLDTSAVAVAQAPEVIGLLGPLLRAGLMYTCPVLDIEALDAARSPEAYRSLALERREAYRTTPLTASVGALALTLQSRLATRAHYRALEASQLIVAATAIENDLTVLHYHRGFEVLGQLSSLAERPVAPLGSLA